MSKYGNVKTQIDGHLFDSKAEANRYRVLRLLEKAGAISQLTLQPTYEILPAFTDSDGKHCRRITYVADFFYYEGEKPVVEDVKGGAVTEAFGIKSKLFRSKYPGIKFVIVRE